MNVESLKSELQQVLDNDVVLRKEFNALKRSLSDYRNQLIMRDEDCKRLQVTIDVLNTKLLVLERDNTNYKAELTAFKELRGTIKEQLQAKQDEIDARLAEIQSLRDDLNVMSASYEARMEELKNATDAELQRVKDEYTSQIHELKTNTHYKESGIRDEFENRVSELTANWADREHSLALNHEEILLALKESHAAEIAILKTEYLSQLSNASSSGQEELAILKLEHQLKVSQFEESFNERFGTMEQNYQGEIASLKSALEEQRSTLTTNFNIQVENLKSELASKENELRDGYEKQIEELRSSQQVVLSQAVLNHENKITSLINEYEEKLANTLIHSTSQNSKLNEELSRVQTEHNGSGERIDSLTLELESKDQEISRLSARLNEIEFQLQDGSLSVSDQVNELNQQITSLNQSHSEYVEELNSQIDNLTHEMKNMGLLLEGTTNSLGETELALENKIKELKNASIQIDELNTKLQSADASDLVNCMNEKYQEQELEFKKLLAENTNLISEIDIAQDKIEAQEGEITLLKGELEEVRQQSLGKSEYFKETLANRNFEITNLEANNAALNLELSHLKNEVAVLRDQTQHSSHSNIQLAVLQQNFDIVAAEKLTLSSEIDVLQTVISGLNESVLAMNEKINAYEDEIHLLKSNVKAEENDAFIDKLFKQIDELNDQKLALLDEKEQMAGQLLKMNEMIGSISQQVDSEHIDVTSLNNHRKNIILANNSGGASEKSQMKEQINDLVREIDKCIALLSA
jgi:chromosome segregation ATPase